MHRNSIVAIAAVLAACYSSGAAWAELRLPNLFSDHMVLQQGQPIPVWGWADAGAEVSVTLGGETATTTADSEGEWRVDLAPISLGDALDLRVAAGDEAVSFSDVVAGEVWICSGQSNMQWSVAQAANPDEEIANADYANIRLFYVPRVTAAEPQDDVDATWERCTPETAKGFSAVAYYFGRKLHQDLDVPIGLIHTSWGGTPAESWASYEMLETDPMSRPILPRWNEIIANYPEAKAAFDKELAEFREAAKVAKEKGEDPPNRPREPQGPGHPWRPASLYNAMIAPLVPFAFQGAIWYQGESNAVRAYQYRSLFQTMIQSWRNAWGGRDFPFLFVQLANFKARQAAPGESDWAELREAQMMALDMPNTGMAVIIDIGEADDIHPKNKQDVGKRLALNALANTYGQDITYSGPLYDSMRIEGDSAVISFKHVDGGLEARGGALKGFSIAGSDRNFVWADARIEGDTVVVSAEGVDEPVAVRYGWADNPECTLYNDAGLPASPFRTDIWPGVTIDNR